MKELYLITFIFLFSLDAKASNAKETFPVLIERGYSAKAREILRPYEPLSKEQALMLQKDLDMLTEESKNRIIDKVVDIPYDVVAEQIEIIKDKLCKVNKNGSFELWLSFTAEAGVVVVAGAHTGFKATINCE